MNMDTNMEKINLNLQHLGNFWTMGVQKKAQKILAKDHHCINSWLVKKNRRLKKKINLTQLWDYWLRKHPHKQTFKTKY